MFHKVFHILIETLNTKKDLKDLLVEDDKKKKHIRLLLDQESVVGVKKELKN